MLSAENGRFTGNRRVARPVNALFAILSDPQFSNGLKAFDNLGQVLLGRRFRPLTQPCERRPVLVIADCKQRLQSRNGLCFQPLDKTLVRAFSGPSALSQANFFQGDRCRKHDASFAQMVDDRSNNGIAAIRAGRLSERSFGGGAIILASKRADAKIGLQFAKVFSTRFIAARVLIQHLWPDAKLLSDERYNVSWRNFVSTDHPARKPKIGKMHGESESIGVSPPPPYQRQILW
jgi:hypothetical protein